MPQISMRDAHQRGAAPRNGARSARSSSSARTCRAVPAARRASARRPAASSASPRACCRSSAIDRVIDTPISESAIIGAAGGAALAGLRPGRRAHVRRLRRRLHGPDLQPDGQVPLHVRRQDTLPAVVIRTAMGAGMNMGAQHSQIDLPAADRGAGPQGRRALERLRRQGPADPGDPRRRPGHVLRAQGALPAQGRSARGRVHDSVRRGEPGARGRARHGRRDRPHGRRSPRRCSTRWRRKASPAT